MKYFLSNRQAKELLVRAAPITVALPVPPGPPRDWTAWARSVLPAEIATYVRAAAERRVIIEPAIGTDLIDITAVLGGIVRYQSLAIVVELCVPHPRSPGSGKIQWPVDVEINGQRKFPPET